MQKKELTYEQAMQKLEELAESMESGKVSVDQMAESLKQAQRWMKYCREQLYEAEKSCKSLLEVNEKE